jgi:hypothetical protein
LLTRCVSGTVTDINRDVAATLKLCGPALLITENGPAVADVVQLLVALITKRHPCQQDLGDEADDDVLEESSEYDWLVVETAMEVVTCLAAALGPSFAELWKVFEKPIFKYASSQESAERVAAVGTIAECIGNMAEACTPYTSSALKLFLHRLSDEDPETKSNAVYASCAKRLQTTTRFSRICRPSFRSWSPCLTPRTRPVCSITLLDV